jgi:hypothetical protein
MRTHHKKEIKDFIKDHSSLLWYIPDEKKENISIKLLLETILNYGDQKSVKKLFELIGINKAAEIFNMQISNKRNNYFAPVKNFFQLYFNRHAQGNFKQ